MPGVEKTRLQKFQKGELRFTEIFDVQPLQIASLLLCGHNFFSQGKLQEAKNIFEGLAVLEPQNPYVQSMLAGIHQKLGNDDVALIRYSRAIELFTADLNALTNRAEIYLNHGKFEEAANDLKRVIELDPQKRSASTIRAHLLIMIATEALKSLKKAKAV